MSCVRTYAAVAATDFHCLLPLRYWRYNEDMRTMDPGYPKPITIWKGIPDSPQGAFVDKANGSFVTLHYTQSTQREQGRENWFVCLIKTDKY